MTTRAHDRLAAITRALATSDLPAALIDLDALDSNAGRLVAAARQMPIRLATKSVRSADLLRYTFKHHPGFVGLMAYAPREAVWLASKGFSDLLVAYPSASEADIERVALAVAAGAEIVLAVDSVAHVELHARVARRVGVVLPICLDIDVSTRFPGLFFGVRRSPVDTVTEALRIALAIEMSGSLRLDGVLGYEAQIAGVRDRLPNDRVMAALMRELKRRSMPEVSTRRTAIVDALRARYPIRFVNGGGTGSVRETRQDSSVTEVAAGSGLFAPTLFDGYDAVPLEPAAFFGLQVTRAHDAETVVCSGGGYIASGPPGWDRVPVPVWPPRGALLPHEGAGEVQTPVRFASPQDRPDIGDVVLFRHAKAGELCERFNDLCLYRQGVIEARAQTFRGEGRSFV